MGVVEMRHSPSQYAAQRLHRRGKERIDLRVLHPDANAVQEQHEHVPRGHHHPLGGDRREAAQAFSMTDIFSPKVASKASSNGTPRLN